MRWIPVYVPQQIPAQNCGYNFVPIEGAAAPMVATDCQKSSFVDRASS